MSYLVCLFKSNPLASLQWDVVEVNEGSYVKLLNGSPFLICLNYFLNKTKITRTTRAGLGLVD